MRRIVWSYALAAALLVPCDARAEDPPQVLAHPSLTVDDRRADEVRHYRSRHELVDPASAEWTAMAPRLRAQILVSAGLRPSLPRTPLRPSIFGALEHDGVLVQKVYFESMPGWYVTGNLYRPVAEGVYPAVLSPHGHWEDGRLHDDELASVPARGIHLARLGFVVFSPDMVGYTDSRQVPHDFTTPADALWGLSALGLQLWNNIRSLDFLQSLDFVDADRIGCTGASGGATQTILLSAIDPRVKVAAPVSMVSLEYHGGCLCENAPSLRLAASNVEITALTAPRPLLLVSATGDWTSEVPQDVAPWLARLYEREGVPDRFASVQFEAEHNYHLHSRRSMYAWFTRWMQGEEVLVEERSIDFDLSRLSVWSADQAPAALDAQGLRRIWAGLTERSLRGSWPRGGEDARRFREQMLPVLTQALGLPSGFKPTEVELGPAAAPWNARRLLIQDEAGEAQVPAVLFAPDGDATGEVVLVVHGHGIAGVFDSSWRDLVTSLAAAGRHVLVIDPFGVGEHQVVERDDSDPRFSCYNRSDPSLAIEDVVLCVDFLRGRWEADEVSLVGIGTGALWSLVAAPLARPDRVLLDVEAFPSAEDAAYLRSFPLPLVRRWGGFATCAALLAPRPLAIHGTAGVFETEDIAEAYGGLDAADRLQIRAEPADAGRFAAWLLDTGS